MTQMVATDYTHVQSVARLLPVLYLSSMPSKELKEAERTARREFILDAAERLVLRKGFDPLTVEEIAAESGYSKRSFYLYFADREELFFGLVLRGYRTLRERLELAFAECAPGTSAIRSFGRRYYGFSRDFPEYFSLIMTYEANYHRYTEPESRAGSGGAGPAEAPVPPRDRCQRASDELGDLLCRALDRDRASGILRTDLPAKPLMLLLWGQLFGFLRILLMRREGFVETYGITEDELFERLLDSVEAANTLDSGSRPD